MVEIMWKSLPVPVRQFAHDAIAWLIEHWDLDLIVFIVAGITMLGLWTIYINQERKED